MDTVIAHDTRVAAKLAAPPLDSISGPNNERVLDHRPTANVEAAGATDLNGHCFACAGGVEDRAKHIKKKRAQDRKNGKKGPKARPGSASQVGRALQAPFPTDLSP